MKNITSLLITTLVILFLSTSLSYGQRYAKDNLEYKPGQVEIKLGIGLVSTFVSLNASTKTPPLSLMVNYRVKKHLNVGAYLGYSSTLYQPRTENEVRDVEEGTKPEDGTFLKNNFYLAGIRLQGHYNQGRVDFYGGAMLGYNFSRIKTNIENPLNRPEGIEIKDANLITYSGFIGLKYVTTSKLGFFGEIGYGASLINLGLSYRL